MIVSHVSAQPKAVRRASGFVLVTLCLLTSGQRKLKWREQANALIERIVGGWSATRKVLARYGPESRPQSANLRVARHTAATQKLHARNYLLEESAEADFVAAGPK